MISVYESYDPHVMENAREVNGHRLWRRKQSMPWDVGGYYYNECIICKERESSGYRSFRRQTCEEVAFNQFKWGNPYRGKRLLERVADYKGIPLSHELAEGIGVSV